MRNLNLISLNNFVSAWGTYYGEYGIHVHCHITHMMCITYCKRNKDKCECTWYKTGI